MHQENTFTLSSEYKDILDQEFSTGFGDVTERLLSGNGTDADQLVVHNLLHDTTRHLRFLNLRHVPDDHQNLDEKLSNEVRKILEQTKRLITKVQEEFMEIEELDDTKRNVDEDEDRILEIPCTN